jgi:hypothetical protein
MCTLVHTQRRLMGAASARIATAIPEIVDALANGGLHELIDEDVLPMLRDVARDLATVEPRPRRPKTPRPPVAEKAPATAAGFTHAARVAAAMEEKDEAA